MRDGILWSLPAIFLLVALVAPSLVKWWRVNVKLKRRFESFGYKGHVPGKGPAPKTPPPSRNPVKLVIAPNYNWFIGWATVDMKVNPSDYTYLSEDRSPRGRRPIPGDEVYVLNWENISGPTERARKTDLIIALLGCGFTTYLDEHRHPGDLRDLIRW